ncbi:MAG TPA: ABC transporter substrate-binding protein [Actinomycetota bacterium]|nr:ABC transporter substrate-binding protein [Actinomycetota bacterium]
MRGRFVALICCLALGPACVGVGKSRAPQTSVEARTDAIVVGAFNFSESRVLAEILRQTITAAGFEAELLGEVGSREIMEPALEQGQVDLVAEYLGTALTFLDPEAAAEIRGPDAAHAELSRRFAERGLTVLSASPGENRNEIVVTRALSERWGLHTITDLQRVARNMVLGGPPECPARPLCLQGLEGLYDLRFESFTPLDSGGPATVASLLAGDVDVALLFTTNPAIDLNDLVVLKDDRDLQPAENIVPVIRREIIDERGPELVESLDAVVSKLTNKALRRLNARAEIDHVAPGVVATEWLEEQGVL